MDDRKRGTGGGKESKTHLQSSKTAPGTTLRRTLTRLLRMGNMVPSSEVTCPRSLPSAPDRRAADKRERTGAHENDKDGGDAERDFADRLGPAGVLDVGH